MRLETEIAIDEILLDDASMQQSPIADAIGLEIARRLQDRTPDSLPQSIAMEVANALRGRTP